MVRIQGGLYRHGGSSSAHDDVSESSSQGVARRRPTASAHTNRRGQ